MAVGDIGAIKVNDFGNHTPRQQETNDNQQSFHKAPLGMGADKVKLNVGCGRNPLKGWINIDRVELPGVDIVTQTMHYSLPMLSDNSVDEFLLSHVIEHIHETLPFMQELYRVAKPGAQMTIRTPYGSSDDAWEDPTHVRPYFINSFLYFSQPAYWRADYGYRGDWQIKEIALRARADYRPNGIFWDRNVIAEMVAKLEAIKPMREPRRELQQAPQVTIVVDNNTDSA